ncbi:N-acetylglucosamine-6-phosphate deacetylase [Salidesulfovibrio onnuriiensis]|uniref:N-acetylglucosamine-6-phosphate deacetylase n=1 Tax=Salidesulfovibrio onnuriiensis TaxID=2583823 RepID=UPI001C9BC9D6|nr:N-acetylglucosamine-6-phosphate deacetylase [Salidesulfovibrio onnuriiensis]
MQAFTNCTIYAGNAVLAGKAVLVEDGKISGVVANDAVPDHAAIVDLQGLSLAPGYIDLQINGCGGRMFNDDVSVETLDIMAKALLPTGCTSFLPTLVTATDEDMLKAVEVVDAYRDARPECVLGVHLEGPYLSRKRRGIHNESLVRQPDSKVLSLVAEHGPEVVRMMTMAPENAGTEYVKQLTDAGIRVSAGHSATPCTVAREAFRNGMTMATHLFNGMEPLMGREPGLVGAVYLERPWTGIIADGVHVAWDNIELAKRILGEKLFLITDAVAPVGTNQTEFQLGGHAVFVKDGKCLSADGTLGGSVLTMDVAVKNCVNHVGIELEEALRMASLYPAMAVGLDHELGRIEPGYFADMVALDDDLNVVSVFKRGQR